MISDDKPVPRLTVFVPVMPCVVSLAWVAMEVVDKVLLVVWEVVYDV